MTRRHELGDGCEILVGEDGTAVYRRGRFVMRDSSLIEAFGRIVAGDVSGLKALVGRAGGSEVDVRALCSYVQKRILDAPPA